MLSEKFGKPLPAPSDSDHYHARRKNATKAQARFWIANQVLAAESIYLAGARRESAVAELGRSDRD